MYEITSSTRLKNQSVQSYYMDLMEDSNCISDMETSKNIFYTFDDDIFRFLSKVDDVEEIMIEEIPMFYSKKIKEKLGIGNFNFLYWKFTI